MKINLTDSESDSTSINSDKASLKTSWIYRLRKDELEAELHKLQLPIDGGMRVQRRRLSNFIKSGPVVSKPVVHELPTPAETKLTTVSKIEPDYTIIYYRK